MYLMDKSFLLNMSDLKRTVFKKMNSNIGLKILQSSKKEKEMIESKEEQFDCNLSL